MSDWIEWKGGDCPVSPDVIVDVRHADGTVTSNVAAGDARDDDERFGFDWWRHFDTSPSNTHGFIIAYRLAPRQRDEQTGDGV